jgi:hypothetical protein
MKILEALRTPKLQELGIREREESVYKIVKALYIQTGQENNDKDVRFLSKLLENDVTTYSHYLKIGELEIALNNGIREMYGKFYSLSLVTFNKMIKKYLQSPERKKALALLTEEIVQKTLPEAPVDTEAIIRRGHRLAFEDYCKDGKMPHYAWKFYDTMNERYGVEVMGPDGKLIKSLVTDVGDMMAIRQQALHICRASVMGSALPSARLPNLKKAGDLKKIIKESELINIDPNEVMNKEKELLLEHYYKQQIALRKNGKKYKN